MGKEKTSGTTVVNQTTTPTQTAEEKVLNQLELGRQQTLYQPSLDLQKQAMNLSSLLLGGGQNLPGFFGNITGGVQTPQMVSPGQLPENAAVPMQGNLQTQNLPQLQDITSQNLRPTIASTPVSEGMVGENDISAMVQRSLRDLYPQFQQQGVLDSGTAAAVAGRTAGDIRTNVAESNINRKLAILESNKQAALQAGQFDIANQIATQQYNQQRRLGTAESDITRALALGQYNQQRDLGIQTSNLERQLAMRGENLAQNLGIQEYNIGQKASNQGFNISNLFNLLNLATGSSAQVQQPQIQQAGLLSQRLAGLRSTNTQGTTTQNQISQTNPFLASMSGIGSALSGVGGAMTGWQGMFGKKG